MKLFSGMRAEGMVDQLMGFDDHHDREAQRIIEKLIQSGPAVIPRVLEMLPLADKKQTISFVDILTKLVSHKSLPHFREALSAEDNRVLAGTVWALSSSQNFDPNKLIELLSSDTTSKTSVLKILEAHKDKLDARQLLAKAYDLSADEKEACMKIISGAANDALVPELVSRLSGKDPIVRMHIINILERFPTPEVQQGLQAQLSDGSKLVRQAALSALAKMADNVDIKLLCRLLQDTEAGVRDKAVDVLARIKHPDTLKYIADALKHEDEGPRRSAVELMNLIAAPESIKTLLDILQDDDWWVRSRATDALAEIGGPKVINATVALIKDPDEDTRRSAIEILVSICTKNPNKQDTESVMSHLIQATADNDWWVRERAADALGEIANPKALPALLQMLSGPAQSIPSAVRAISAIGDQQAVNKLLPLVDHQDRQIRLETIHALGKMASQNNVEVVSQVLQSITNDKDHDIKDAALNALTDIDNRFSASMIAMNHKAEQLADATKTLLLDTSEDTPDKFAPPTVAQVLDIENIKPGDVIDSRYEFIKQIGKGAFGTVLLVEDKVVHEQLVLKFLNKQISSDDDMMKRFVHELRYSRKITHRNVIRIYDFLSLGGLYAISMEYFESHTLSKLVANKKPVKLDRALTIVRDITSGMTVAHNTGIVHRDLKPANVLINDEDLVKVVDFGVAAAHTTTGDTQLTKTGFVIGSPKYMAPEQILGKDIDQRADIYATGVILYELLTGKPPYADGDHMAIMYQHVQGKATPVEEVNKKIPINVAAIVRKAMAIDKMKRYQTMEELRLALETQL